MLSLTEKLWTFKKVSLASKNSKYLQNLDLWPAASYFFLYNQLPAAYICQITRLTFKQYTLWYMAKFIVFKKHIRLHSGQQSCGKFLQFSQIGLLNFRKSLSLLQIFWVNMGLLCKVDQIKLISDVECSQWHLALRGNDHSHEINTLHYTFSDISEVWMLQHYHIPTYLLL